MDAITVQQTDAVNQMDLDFRLNLFPGSIKKAMQFGNQDVVKEGEVAQKFGSSDLWNIDPRVIQVIPGYNTRVKNATYKERVLLLKKSMKEVGFKKDSPLSVIVVEEENGKLSIKLKRGHRRLEAVMAAIAEGKPFETVPCVIVKDDVTEEDLTADLVLSNNGDPLDPYATAIVCKRMTRWYPDNHAKIAAKLGLWPSQVTDYLLLINGPVEVSNYVRDEVIAFTLAVELLKEHGPRALGVIEQSLARSKAAGKTKLMPRFVPGKVIKKAVTAAAPAMKAAIVEIKSDKAFSQLSPETQEKLEAILEQFKQAEEAEAKLNAENPTDEPELNLDKAEV
ncbi:MULTISPECIES: ParB/RepB/Spo0J family partition protein [unclassified Pseudomonas]|uniref:ParB/RepB/Spo0J family partition protein n=1 Tax=unclassified Pseudomonas TaxID=196821 RepID=UPI001CBF90CA|nr:MULTISPECIES: ParB N-terminal domain-containing protein [unclassified Pseudomonas]